MEENEQNRIPKTAQEFVINQFRDAVEGVEDLELAYEAEEDLQAAARSGTLEEVRAVLDDNEDDLNVSFQTIRSFIDHAEEEDLLKTDDIDRPDDTVDAGVKMAMEMQASQLEDGSVVTIDQRVTTEGLLNLSEQIYKKYRTPAFFISPQRAIEGRVTVELQDTKEKFDLMTVYQNREGEFYFKHFGRKNPNKGYNAIESFSDSFFQYKFIADDEMYILFSKERIDPQRCRIHGTLYSVNDAKQVGDQRKLPVDKDVIFVHSVEPSIRALSEEEYEELKPDIDHDWLAERILGIFRHPDWFEKLLLSVLFVKDENDFPSHIIWLAKQGTGKSYTLEGINRAMGEPKQVMSGTDSRMKGLTPSFRSRPPKEGYLLESQRTACVDEFFNFLQHINEGERQEDVFRVLLDLLEHKNRLFGSGNGSIRGKMEATMIAAGNPAYGMKNSMVGVAEKTDGAFLSRCLLYNQTEAHVEYIEARKTEIEKKKDEVDDPFPEEDMEFLSLLDMLCEEVRFKHDYDRIDEMKEKLQNIVPSSMKDVFRARAVHHIKNLASGVAKYNSMVESRDEFEITEKDYDDTQTLFEILISSWTGQKNLKNLSRGARIPYLSHTEREVFELLKRKYPLTEDEIDAELDGRYGYEIEHLADLELIERLGDGDGASYAPLVDEETPVPEIETSDGNTLPSEAK